MPVLAAESKLLNDAFGYGSRIASKDELQRKHVRDAEAHGAMWEPDGTGIQAAKLAFGYLRAARRLGAKVHRASSVTGWETRGGVHSRRSECVT